MFVAAYAAAGFWLVPRILRSQAEAFASEKYGREVSLGEIRFNPFSFELTVGDFSFPDVDGKPLAAFDKLLVNLELSSIWRAGASFREISIEQPYLRAVIRESGELNFADLAKPFPEEPEDPAEPDEPPRLFINLFSMTAGHVDFTDRTLVTPYSTAFKPLSFELRDFSTTANSDNAYDLHARAGTGASLGWSGNFSLSPLASRGRFRFANIQAAKHWGYGREAAGFDVTSGVLGFDGDYDFSAGKAGTQIKFNLRELGIDDLGIRRIGEDTDTARFARLTISNLAFDLAKNTLNIEKVLAAGGSVEAWRDADGNLNLVQLTTPAGATPAPAGAAAPAAEPLEPDQPVEPAEPESPILVTAPDIELQGLVVHVEDRQIEPAIELMLDPFNLRLMGFSTAPGTTIGIV
ncbi:MAG: DUF748 domain-containing protein, partial [Steroidobacteraceae bacterium]